jgi:hypothetical protein
MPRIVCVGVAVPSVAAPRAAATPPLALESYGSSTLLDHWCVLRLE